MAYFAHPLSSQVFNNNKFRFLSNCSMRVIDPINSIRPYKQFGRDNPSKSMLLSVPNFTANLYCICWSIDLRSILKLLYLLILDGNSEIGAHVRSNLWYLICLRHWFRPRAVGNCIIFSARTYFPLCVRNIFWVTI